MFRFGIFISRVSIVSKNRYHILLAIVRVAWEFNNISFCIQRSYLYISITRVSIFCGIDDRGYANIRHSGIFLQKYNSPRKEATSVMINGA